MENRVNAQAVVWDVLSVQYRFSVKIRTVELSYYDGNFRVSYYGPWWL